MTDLSLVSNYYCLCDQDVRAQIPSFDSKSGLCSSSSRIHCQDYQAVFPHGKLFRLHRHVSRETTGVYSNLQCHLRLLLTFERGCSAFLHTHNKSEYFRLRSCTSQMTPMIPDPLDYEDFVQQNKTIIQNDPHRELLVIPADDISSVRIPRKIRTTKATPSIIGSSLPVSGVGSGSSDQTPCQSRKVSASSAASSSTNNSASFNTNSNIISQSYTTTAPQKELASNTSTPNISSNRQRTLSTTTNGSNESSTCSFHVKECIDSFVRDWNTIQFKYEPYSGNWSELPRLPKIHERLQDQVYEIDDDCDGRTGSEDGLNGLSLLTKEGYILKGSEAGTDSIFSVATKSFKKRWMSLRQELDGSCSVEFFKDNKKLDSKGSICLDLCHQIVKNPKRGKYAFELRMIEGHKPCILATESEADLESWIDALIKASTSKSETSSRKSVAFPELEDRCSNTSGNSSGTNTPQMGQSFRASDLSKLPDLQKYSRETESSISSARKESRVNVFSVYPDLLSRRGNFPSLKHNYNTVSGPIEPYKQIFGYRFLFTFDKLDFNLKTLIEGVVSHVEPFFASVAIFHTKLGKITEEFRFDVNDRHTRAMILNPEEDLTTVMTRRMQNSGDELDDVSPRDFPKNWVTNPKSALFSVQSPSPDMFLVMRIEKVLTGPISSSSEPYIKTNEPTNLMSLVQANNKMGIKCHKQAKVTCARLGADHRMPFVWSARPIFKSATKTLDTESEFGPFYRQDSHKNSDEEIVKHLNELRSGLDKPKNVTIVPGRIFTRVGGLAGKHDDDDGEGGGQDTILDNTVSCNYLPVEPFSNPPSNRAIIEVAEFLMPNPRESFPFTEFVNLLFVHPRLLKYDCQKVFPKARNISITVEYRESDAEDAVPLKVLFARPCSLEGLTTDFVSRLTTNILHHNTTPDFYDEIKLLLPLTLTEKSHLLFTLNHVSCSASMSSKKDNLPPVETPVGYSWIQVYPQKGRLSLQETSLPVAAHLPAGYLSYKPLGLGRGYAGPEIKWIDSGKEIFRVGFKLVSSIFPLDQSLHSFLYFSGKMLDCNLSSTEAGGETSSLFNRSLSEVSDGDRGGFSRFVQAQHGMPKILKSLMESDISSLIRFFPVLMTQLLRMIVSTTSDDVQQSALRVIIHILHSIKEVRKEDIAVNYVEFYFSTEFVSSPTTMITLHEELIRSMVTLLRHSKDEFPVVNNLIENIEFFFQLTLKSMANHLLSSGRIKMRRNERFPKDFQEQLLSFIDLLIQLIVDKNKDLGVECKAANVSLAHFLTRSFGLMDRGFVFRLIKVYLDKVHAAKDSVSLQLHKFEFLAHVTAYEHHIPINLPFGPRNQSPHSNSNGSTPSKNMNGKKGKGVTNTSTCIVELDEDDSIDSRSRSSRASTPSSPPSVKIPLTPTKTSSKQASIEEEIFLSDDFLRAHFTAGILLQETKGALSEVHQIRGMALSVLRNLLVKHSLDDRYASRGQQSRIASLYFPFLPVILENINRIHVGSTGGSFNSGGLLGSNIGHFMGAGSINSTLSMVSKRVSFIDGLSNPSPTNTLDPNTVSAIKQSISNQRKSSLEMNTHKRDSSYLQLIASGGNPLMADGGLGSSSNSSTTTSLMLESQTSVSSGFGSETSSSLLSAPLPGHLNSSDPDISSKSPSPDLVDALLSLQKEQSKLDTGGLHQRSLSLPVRFDKLNATEARDMLIIFSWIVKHVSEDSLTNYLKKSTDVTLLQFMSLLEMCLHEFKYNGRKESFNSKKSTLSSYSSSSSLEPKAMTLPARMFDPMGSNSEKANQVFSNLLEANLATEVGMITLDVIGIILKELTSRVCIEEGNNGLMKKIFCLFLTFLRLGQSETLLRHLFASFRSFVNKFPDILFAGLPCFVGELCFELLKSCSSKISSVRSESAALLYLLMRANYSYKDQASMTRVHLQVIISVSKLLGDSNIVLLNNSRFQESLAIINNFSSSDKTMKDTDFPKEVRELTKKIRTVLMATAAMREHENDPEMLMDLQCSLANSYAETSPALRRTWLESMAKNHKKEGNLSEAAHCFAHIAALESEIIRKRLTQLAEEASLQAIPHPLDFSTISCNIPRDESDAGSKSCDGSHGNDEHFSETGLIETLETTAALFARAERYEVVPEVYKIMIPIQERKRNFEALSKIYKTVSATYDKVLQVKRSGKRILGRYYRVAFFGKEFFDEESGKEFVYKEPKVTSLPEISDRLRDIFGKKFGPENVKLIMSEREVDEKLDCDPKYAYIQVTHVHPFNHSVEPNDRVTEFEKMDNNLNKFMFETPFSLSDPSKARSAFCNDQCKRRTILTTAYQFPYVVKRIPVISKSVSVLSPIEVAIDEMETRVKELEDVCVSCSASNGGGSDNRPDLKKLQLKLQGSVSVTVNAGPLAYARAFLTQGCKDSHGHSFPPNKVKQLQSVFIDFTQVCEVALDWNEKLIASDQHEYHMSLKSNFQEMVADLSQFMSEPIMSESVLVHDTSLTNSHHSTIIETNNTPLKQVNGTASPTRVASPSNAVVNHPLSSSKNLHVEHSDSE